MTAEDVGDWLLASGTLDKESLRQEIQAGQEQNKVVGDGDARRELPSKIQDGHDLAVTGWGVIVAANSGDRLLERLRPLLDHRRKQAGDLYRENLRYDKRKTPRGFIWDRGIGPGIVDPKKLPYYLLIAGGPQEIEFELQYQLSLQRAVGRIAFEDDEDYERYARAVVEIETNGCVRPRRATLFTADNGDDATRLLEGYLARPLEEEFAPSVGPWEFEVQRRLSKSDIKDYLGGEKTPGLVLAACHGFNPGFKQPRQKEEQGSLVSQDWQESAGELTVQQCLSGDDLAESQNLDGVVAFLFACYGAGTPDEDNFPHVVDKEEYDLDRKPKFIATKTFVARLPQVLLSRGALAVIGHVDRGWTTSFSWKKGDRRTANTATVEDTIRRMLNGERVGHAFRSMNRRYAHSAGYLAELMGKVKDGVDVNKEDLGTAWLAHSDARNFILLGDPAVYLLGQRQEEEWELVRSDHTTTTPMGDLAPDLNLVVEEERQDSQRRLVFRLASSVDGARFTERKYSSKPFKTEDPQAYAEALLQDIQNPENDVLLARQKMTSFGGVLKELFPEQLLEELRILKDSARNLRIVSELDWIPWEGVKLGDGENTPFLGEAFAVTRWLPGANETLHLPMRRVALIAPKESGLAAADQERNVLRSGAGRDRRVDEPTSTAQGVMDAIADGGYDGWHFVGHGDKDDGVANLWPILLDGGKLTPSDLLVNKEKIRRAKPMVFFNGCHTGHGGTSFTEPGGWAAQWISAGAGAFIGASWAVKDRSAAAFSKAFYQEFMNGEEIAVAVHRARLEVRQQYPDDPSWLAYTVFAHPRARCTAPPRLWLKKSLLAAAALAAILLTIFMALGWHGAYQEERAKTLTNDAADRVKNNDFDEARIKLNEALEVLPDFAPARANLAALDRIQGDIDAALAGYRQAIESDPESADYHFNLGALLNANGNPTDARPLLEKAIELDVGFHPAYNELGKLYLNSERVGDARQILEKGVETAPDFAPLRKNLARALLAADEPAAALPHLNAALGKYESGRDRMEAYKLSAEAHDALKDSAAVCESVARFDRILGSAFSPWAEDVRVLAEKHDCTEPPVQP